MVVASVAGPAAVREVAEANVVVAARAVVSAVALAVQAANVVVDNHHFFASLTLTKTASYPKKKSATQSLS